MHFAIITVTPSPASKNSVVNILKFKHMPSGKPFSHFLTFDQRFNIFLGLGLATQLFATIASTHMKEQSSGHVSVC